MLVCEIPGRGELRLEHLVLDYNGTIACDGALLPDVVERLLLLSQNLRIHLVTADTFGSVAKKTEGLPLGLTILTGSDHTKQKGALVERLGAERCAAIGNGANDAAMLEAAAVGIAVAQTEGCALSALRSADILCTSVTDALDLLLFPNRLRATLRL